MHCSIKIALLTECNCHILRTEHFELVAKWLKLVHAEYWLPQTISTFIMVSEGPLYHLKPMVVIMQ